MTSVLCMQSTQFKMSWAVLSVKIGFSKCKEFRKGPCFILTQDGNDCKLLQPCIIDCIQWWFCFSKNSFLSAAEAGAATVHRFILLIYCSSLHHISFPSGGTECDFLWEGTQTLQRGCGEQDCIQPDGSNVVQACPHLRSATSNINKCIIQLVIPCPSMAATSRDLQNYIDSLWYTMMYLFIFKMVCSAKMSSFNESPCVKSEHLQ